MDLEQKLSKYFSEDWGRELQSVSPSPAVRQSWPCVERPSRCHVGSPACWLAAAGPMQPCPRPSVPRTTPRSALPRKAAGRVPELPHREGLRWAWGRLGSRGRGP